MTPLFMGVERLIGQFVNLGVRALLRHKGATEACAEVDFLSIPIQRQVLQRASDLAQHATGGGGVDLGENDHEFVGAQPRPAPSSTRTQSFSFCASALRQASPAGWPWVSLIALKLSKSISAMGLP